MNRRCSDCGKLFTTRPRYDDHVLEVHGRLTQHAFEQSVAELKAMGAVTVYRGEVRLTSRGRKILAAREGGADEVTADR